MLLGFLVMNFLGPPCTHGPLCLAINSPKQNQAEEHASATNSNLLIANQNKLGVVKIYSDYKSDEREP